ncbi:hypothetical protein ACTFIV_008831 [Dictyostelium citrinum]
MSATQKQSDVDIALTSKRINMALEKKNTTPSRFNFIIMIVGNAKKSHTAYIFFLHIIYVSSSPNYAKNRAGNNRPRTYTNNNNTNNTKKFIGSPKVKKTFSTSPMRNKLVSPDKIKIQIQNNKAKPSPKPIVVRPKMRATTQQRSTRAPTRSISTRPTRTITASSKKPSRVVTRYEKPVTLNDRFSKK